MLDPRIFARRGLSAGSLAILAQSFAFFGFIFLFLQYLQLVRGDSALVAALSLLPMAAALMPTTRLVPVLAARVGAGRVCATGLVLLAVAGSVLAAHLDGPLTRLVPGDFVAGLHAGLTACAAAALGAAVVIALLFPRRAAPRGS